MNVHAPPAILVADDDPLVRRLMVRVLSREGFVVHEASDGQHALEVLQQQPGVELVISDIVMPRLDGHGLLRAIRQADPDLPVVMVTGYDFHTDAPRAEHVLPKPFRAEQLVRLTRSLLARG